MVKTLARALAFAAPAAALALPARAADMLKVGKAALTSSAILPLDVGVKEGLFAKHGLDVQIINFQGSSRLHQAMIAGSVDMGIGAGPELALIAKGAPVRAVCESSGPPAFLGLVVLKDSPIKSVADLKGKRIGVSSVGGLTYSLALELSEKQGWGRNGVKVVAVGNAPSSVVSSLRAHNVDADFTSTSLIFTMEKRGEGRLLASASAFSGSDASGVIFARAGLADSNPGAVRAFLAGWLDTIAFMKAHPDAAIRDEAAVTTFPLDVQAKEFHLTYSMFRHDCKFTAESLANLKRMFVATKRLPASVDMSKLYREVPAELLVSGGSEPARHGPLNAAALSATLRG